MGQSGVNLRLTGGGWGCFPLPLAFARYLLKFQTSRRHILIRDNKRDNRESDTVASPRIFEWGVGVMTSKPTYLPPILCFSSFLGHLILLTHRLHNFRYFFDNKKT